MKRFGFALLLLVAMFVSASAVASAQIALYGAATGSSFSNAPDDIGYGGMVGAYKQSGHFIGTGLDLRGTFVGRNGFRYNTFAVGPRVAFKPRVIPLMPYVEGLVGLANYNSGKNTGSTNHLNYQVVGGLDATILPRIDWRVVDVAYSGVASQSIKAVTFSTGLVIRIW